MPKSSLALLPPDYATVAERIARFYERFPDGRIVTRLISRSDRDVVFRAAVYRTANEFAPAATGWAAEREGDGEINVNACLENTETSAIGRALANLGFAAVPSRVKGAVSSAVPAAAGPATVDLAGAATTASPAPAHTGALHARAAIADDLLALLRAAERAGLGVRRVELLHRHISSGDLPAPRLERVARLLRRWLRARVERELATLSVGAGVGASDGQPTSPR